MEFEFAKQEMYDDFLLQFGFLTTLQEEVKNKTMNAMGAAAAAAVQLQGGHHILFKNSNCAEAMLAKQ